MTSVERREQRYQRRKAKREEKKQQFIRKYDSFDRVFTYDHLYHSYRLCRKGVRWKASTQKYIANAPLNLYDTYQRLHNGTFKSKGFNEFKLNERGKTRHIRSIDFQERIVQRCLCDYSLTPILTRTFIHDNGATIQRKGHSFAVKRMQRHMQYHIRKHGDDGYILLFDFSGYFDSISHEHLFEILKDQYSDKRILSLLRHFVEMFGDRGLGLGSQVSQVLALAAANQLDHFVKEVLHIKCYGRYMDDGYLIHESKEYLEKCLERIREKCNELGLTLHAKKTRIVPLRHNFMWLKIRYHVTKSGRIVKRVWKKSVTRMRRKLKKLRLLLDNRKIELRDIAQSYRSWRSHISGLDVYLTKKRMDELFYVLFEMEVI